MSAVQLWYVAKKTQIKEFGDETKPLIIHRDKEAN